MASPVSARSYLSRGGGNDTMLLNHKRKSDYDELLSSM